MTDRGRGDHKIARKRIIRREEPSREPQAYGRRVARSQGPWGAVQEHGIASEGHLLPRLAVRKIRLTTQKSTTRRVKTFHENCAQHCPRWSRARVQKAFPFSDVCGQADKASSTIPIFLSVSRPVPALLGSRRDPGVGVLLEVGGCIARCNY